MELLKLEIKNLEEQEIRIKTEKEGLVDTEKTLEIDIDREKRIIIDGKNFDIFLANQNKISEFKNLKIYIKFIPLITKQELVTNEIKLVEGKINIPAAFSKPLDINYIQLKGDMNPKNKEIKISNFYRRHFFFFHS